MREIKFRAWDKANNRFYNLVETRVPELNHGDDDGVIYMQYTGLKDKNGKEIYEGDILRTDKGINAVVYWSNSGACFMVKYHNIWSTKIGWYIYKNLRMFAPKSEVIGNIYENPELLE